MSLTIGSKVKGRHLLITTLIVFSLIFVFPYEISENVDAIDDINMEMVGNVTKNEHFGHNVISVDISPNEDYVAVGLNNGTVFIYYLDSWNIVTVLYPGGWVYDIEWCPVENMKMIAVSLGTQMGYNNGKVKIFSSTTWDLIEEMEYDQQVYSISWNSDGSLLAVAAIYYLDILYSENWTSFDSITYEDNITQAVEWHPSLDQLAIGRLEWNIGGSVDIYVPGSGVVYSHFTGFRQYELFNPSILEWDDGSGWLGIANSSLKVIDPENDLQIFDLGEIDPTWITDLAWINNSNQLLVANGSILDIYDMNSGQKEFLIDLPDPHQIKMIALTEDENTLFICHYSSLYIIELIGFKDENSDLDKDSVINSEDAFPDDPAASVDDDTDGYPSEWNPGKTEADSTTGLKLDEFPTDPGEWFDSDSDSIGNNADGFPFDPAAWVDTDGDGFPDRWNPGKTEADSTTGLKIDVFPLDGSEWADMDSDGKGDNSDLFPADPREWADSDHDGAGNNGDAFPTDPSASIDSDDDGYPDRWNPGMSEENSTLGLKIDHYPLDPQKHSSQKELIPNSVWVLAPIILITLMIILLLAVLLIARSRRNSVRSLSPEEGWIKKYKEDFLHGIEETDFDLPDDELVEMLSKKKRSGEISNENYTFIIEKVLRDH